MPGDNVVISVENLSKQYRLGQIGTGTLSHDLNRWWQRIRGNEDSYRTIGDNNDPSENVNSDYVWALKGVSFEVRQGEVLGIIGKNGAGKSTLLKILSRVTTPERGQIKVKGRIASLLEVGTGFHPELTGRENIFLNGAILGMRRREIERKLDEIIDFSGCDRYIDTPVKRYSSGMYVRLAFAVAAHLDPEILVVDEVLAVGDAEFQKKCLGKMKDISLEQGRTVLFVSHQIGMISSLCSRVILLEAGKLAASGPPAEVINRYFRASGAAPHAVDFRVTGKLPGDHRARLLYARIEDEHNQIAESIDIRRPFSVTMAFEILEDVPKGPYPNFHFFDSRGEYAFVAGGTNLVGGPVSKGTYFARCIVPGGLLNDGAFTVGLALTFTHNGIEVSFYERQGLSFVVVDPIEETLMESRGGYSGAVPGPVRPKLDWHIERLA
jgi:lipopolysaccharide transport system ATP-binding protein